MGITEREKIYTLLDEIRALVEENELEDGTFRFDPVRALIALDFAKTVQITALFLLTGQNA